MATRAARGRRPWTPTPPASSTPPPCGRWSTPRPTSPVGSSPTRPPWSTRPGWPGDWPRRPRPAASRIAEDTRLAGLRRDGRRRGRDDGERGHGARQVGRAGDQRVPRPAAPGALVGGARLRLRAGHRAAHRRAARRDRVGPEHRDRGLRQPVPLLPAHPGPPDPLGRLRRHLPLRSLDRPRPRGPPDDVRDPGAQLRRDLPAAARASGSPTAGPGSSTPRTRFCALFGTRARRSDGLRRPASPVSASGRRGSRPT